MEQRFIMEQVLPEAWKAMYGLSLSIKKPSLTPIQRHLIMMRASQINGCAFCINMHSKEALQLGETQQRLFLLNAWKETDVFTEEEKAILAIAEEVTLISQHGVSDAVYKNAERFFSKETIAEIIMVSIVINGWNRIAVSTHRPIEN